jgi:AcrR family transcriptional regulator
MRVPRQEESLKDGRVNQKRRTRTAIVAAAKDLIENGVTPTVAQAAEAALVSRTTAYRYFPTQESLLVEVAMNDDVDDIERLVAASVGSDAAQERALGVLDLFNRHVFAAESQYRTALRLYLDLWLAAAAAGDDAPVVREGRRRRWFEQSLAPLRSTVDDREWDRLVAALCVLGGAEAAVVLRDVCQLEPEKALAITGWAAETLLRETFGTAKRRRSS